MELFSKDSNNKKKKAVRSASGGRTAAAVIAIVLTLVILACAGGTALVSRIDTVYPNVKLDGMGIGGMTDLELAKLLLDKGYDSVGDNSVKVELPLDNSLEIRAEEVCSNVAVEDIVSAVMAACSGDSAVGGAVNYVKCLLGGMELESGAAISVDEAAVKARVDNIAREIELALTGSDLSVDENSIRIVKGAKSVTLDSNEITKLIVEAFEARNYEPIKYEGSIEMDEELDINELRERVFSECADAFYDGETDSIVAETVGVSFDTAEAQRLWDKAVYGEEVIIPLIIEQPEVTAAKLEELLFSHCFCSKSTTLWGSSDNRINNVTKAAASVNEFVLMPGEEFSYNDVLGERTKENGYLQAGAYSDGQTVQEYGGGICQISSAVYYCALYANLKITSRTCHMFPVGYVPPGLDATVSWGGPEFKFVNNRDYPIKIKAWIEDKNAIVEIWGTDVDGSYVEMTYSTALVYDKEFTEVAIGYKATSYRSVYDKNGNLLSQKLEANSRYSYHEEDIEWPEPSEEPEVSPEVTDQPQQPEETPDIMFPPEETPDIMFPPETEEPLPEEDPEEDERPGWIQWPGGSRDEEDEIPEATEPV